MRVKFNIDTMLYIQIGSPMDHSCAALVHNKMYEIANLNAVNITLEVKKGELAKFIEAAKTFNAKGFDITMPHKSDIIQYLDVCEESSRAFKCVNHVKIVDGKLHGVGLDGVSMGLAIQHDGVKIKDSVVLILGAGAVAGPIAADLVQRGAKKIIVANRTQEKAKYIVDTLKQLYKTEAEYGPFTDDYICKAAQGADILVQCTSLGMAGQEPQYESFEFLKKLPKDAAVAEVLFPTSKLLETAGALGLKTVSGMGMMLHQQLAMMEFKFGIKMPDYTLDAAHEALELAIVVRDRRLKALKKK